MWSLLVLTQLSQAGIVGWPLDFISPLALLGVPGNPDRIAVGRETLRWAGLSVLSGAAVGFVLLFWWKYRHETTVAERSFVALASGSLLLYCVYFLVQGPSYQQWKLASYGWLPFSFVGLAGCLRLWALTSWGERVRRSTFGRRTAAAGLLLVVLGLVGGNLAVHARAEAPLLRLRAAFRNLAVLDTMRSFHEMDLATRDYQSTMLAMYFVRTKLMHPVGQADFPSEAVDYERISADRPLFVQDFGCEGVGHRDTMSIPDIGCLLFSPPSVALDTPYSLNRTFMPVTVEGFGGREPQGRRSIRRRVGLELIADLRRIAVDQDAWVNLLITPRFTDRQPVQRLAFSWGQGRKASGALSSREWISLGVRSEDWRGERIRTLAIALDLFDAGAPGSLVSDSQVPVRASVLLEEVSISTHPAGRVMSGGERR